MTTKYKDVKFQIANGDYVSSGCRNIVLTENTLKADVKWLTHPGTYLKKAFTVTGERGESRGPLKTNYTPFRVRAILSAHGDRKENDYFSCTFVLR